MTDHKVFNVNRLRMIKLIGIPLAVSVVMAIVLYYAMSMYVIEEASGNIRDVLLSHRGVHLYIQRIMHPEFYRAQAAGKVSKDYYAPEVYSSSFLVRNLHVFYNEELKRLGLPEIYYKMAADNPRNPVNKADASESRLIQMFNMKSDLKEYRETVKIDGKKYLYYAIPFIRTNAACLKCHGKREDAPAGLQARYQGQGGFGDKIGHIRAIESIRVPIDQKLQASYVVAGSVSAGMLSLVLLVMFNSTLRGAVKAKTATLEREIGERKQAEETLRDKEKQFRSILGTVQLIGVMLDSDGKITLCNDYLLNLTGWKREEVMQQSWFELFLPHDVRSTIQVEVFQKALKMGEIPPHYENEIITRGGKRRLIAWNNTILFDRERIAGVASIGDDITDRKQAVASLQASENLYRKMNENSPLGMHFYQLNGDQQLIFVGANPAADKLLKVDNSQFIGKTIEEAFASLVQTEVPERYRDAAAKGIPWFTEQIIYEDKKISGAFEVRAFQTTPGSMVAIFADITDRKKAEEEKERLQSQLIQTQKIEAIGQLAGGVAHDFNNMLGVILGHTEIALDRVSPDDPLNAHLAEIQRAAKRSSDLTSQLLAFARKQTMTPKVLDLNNTIDGMLKMLRRLIGEDIDLTWLPDAALWPLKIDPSQIDQIMANLCVNARDAIQGVGKVTIETRNICLDDDYCADHADFVPGIYVQLCVSDNGCGMDKEILDKLFEPFFTTKGVGKGTGLGLATVYGIVKQNGGFINVYSEPGQGTTFRLYLPRYEGQTDQASTETAPESRIRGHETILLVEDEPSLLELNKLILESQGYRVVDAGTPGEAIRLAEEHAGKINLLMTDVVMPEMNGRDLAKNLFALNPNLKCLFTSGYTANVIAHHGVLDEGVFFIQKPFSRKDLAAKVREVLDQK